MCQCLPGFGGPECEKLLSVNFVDRDTYLQFTDLQDWPRANITLQVCASGPGYSQAPLFKSGYSPVHRNPKEPVIQDWD